MPRQSIPIRVVAYVLVCIFDRIMHNMAYAYHMSFVVRHIDKFPQSRMYTHPAREQLCKFSMLKQYHE